MESESKDPTKVEIIKQIKKVNDDGSYTFGYEAEDGTFKIESRDVLGNVKGTFGFVDTDGEIKRVSYSTTNATESATVSSADKERSQTVQSIPKVHNRTIVSTTRRPNIIYPSSVIQSIPRRRIISSSSTTSSSSSNSNISTASTTERPSYKNLVKAHDFDITARSSSTTESPIRSSTVGIRPAGHFIRSSTISPHSDNQRFTEGQLIRPTQPDIITPRPTESYTRRLLITRNPYLDEQSASTVKPVEEQAEEHVRGNLLRRQLSQEKISTFDTRQHIINLQQSVGDDSTDVYSGSFTTGAPRPLFTTTDRPRIFATPTASTIKGITPAKYQSFYQKNLARGARPTPTNYITETTTTDSSNTDPNYVTPNPLPVVQIPNTEEVIPMVRRHPFHRGAYLIPVNQYQGNRYVLEEPHEDVSQQQYVTQYAYPTNQQYIQETNHIAQMPYHIIPKRRPIPILPIDDYRSVPVDNLFTPHPQQAYQQIAIPAHPMIEMQEEIDNIKPPVSTKDFQKLLNRLIFRQSQLQEISRLEQTKGMQQNYYAPERYRVQPTPVSVFVRTRPEIRHNNGPVQFVSAPQNPRQRPFISIEPQRPISVQQKMIETQNYNSIDYNNNYMPEYRSSRRVARLLHPNTRPKDDENENLLPPDVREMLLLRMLQLAINPNLPLPPSEGETMASVIRETKKKPIIRNVEILGEERDEEKPVTRSKRYRESDEYDYY